MPAVTGVVRSVADIGRELAALREQVRRCEARLASAGRVDVTPAAPLTVGAEVTPLWRLLLDGPVAAVAVTVAVDCPPGATVGVMLTDGTGAPLADRTFATDDSQATITSLPVNTGPVIISAQVTGGTGTATVTLLAAYPASA